MRRTLALATLAACAPATSTPQASWDGTGLVIRDGERTLLRTAGPPAEVRDFVEEARGPFAIWSFTRSAERREVPEGEPEITVDDDVFTATWPLGAGALTVTVAPGEVGPEVTITPPEGHDSVALRLDCDAVGTFHGFGTHYGALDHRGAAFDVLTSEQGIGRTGVGRDFSGDEHTTYFALPYWLDARGAGALLHTDERLRLDLCATEGDVGLVEVVSGEPVALTVLPGPTPAEVVRQLGALTGVPRPVPDWAFDPWLAAQGGTEAVRAEWADLTAAGVLLGAIWSQDWTGIRRNLSGGFGVEYRWEADTEVYAGLDDLIADLHEAGVRFLAYVNPFIDPALPNHFDALEALDGLLVDEAGEPYLFPAPNVQSAHPDLTHPPARDYVRDTLAAAITDWEIDGWMADFGEWTPLDAVAADGSTGMPLHHRFPVQWHGVVRDAIDAARPPTAADPSGDFATFARSGWRGVHAVSQIHWIGDQEADWSTTDGLPTVVPGMVSAGLSGVRVTTHDIAGFSGGPSTEELFQRWTELGAFTPIFRTHDGDARDANWRWDRNEATAAHFLRMAAVHGALRDDFLRWRDTLDGPIVRALLLDWPDDEATWPIADQYTLGGEVLVAPVVTEGATTRTAYLPEGAWFHVWTGARTDGPATVTVDAPLGEPPAWTLGRDRPELREAARDSSPSR